MTLALLNDSSPRTEASSPVPRCLTYRPVRAGKSASCDSSSFVRSRDGPCADTVPANNTNKLNTVALVFSIRITVMAIW